MSESLLRIGLETAVPLWIYRVRPNLDVELKTAGDLSLIIAEHGDVLLFKSKKKGATAESFNALAKALALLSFAPGGVTFLGLHFESQRDFEEK